MTTLWACIRDEDVFDVVYRITLTDEEAEALRADPEFEAIQMITAWSEEAFKHIKEDTHKAIIAEGGSVHPPLTDRQVIIYMESKLNA